MRRRILFRRINLQARRKKEAGRVDMKVVSWGRGVDVYHEVGVGLRCIRRRSEGTHSRYREYTQTPSSIRYLVY